MGLGARPSESLPIVLDDIFALDQARLDDAAAMRRLALDPAAARFFGWTVKDASAQPDSHYEDGIRRFAREWDEGTRFALTIRRRVNGEPVGTVELRPRPGSQAEADVSYMIAPELRGQGIAPRALERLLAWGTIELGLRVAHLGCNVDNAASRRVAEKCRFLLVDQVGDELRFRRNLNSTGH